MPSHCDGDGWVQRPCGGRHCYWPMCLDHGICEAALMPSGNGRRRRCPGCRECSSVKEVG